MGRRDVARKCVSKTLVDLLPLEWVLPVPEAPVKNRDPGVPWLQVVPLVGDAEHIMVMWLIPVNQSHSDFFLPPHSDTSLYHDLLVARIDLFCLTRPSCIQQATPNTGGWKAGSHGAKTPVWRIKKDLECKWHTTTTKIRTT